MKLLQHIKNDYRKNKRQFAVLLDPDNTSYEFIAHIIPYCKNGLIHYIFLGGSLIHQENMDRQIEYIKAQCDIPIILFPGSTNQVTEQADALMFLSLISGRNADLLIGKHVEIAPFVKRMNLEVIPTGYMLIDGGRPTTASYISNTTPIPRNKPQIAASTALAGELLGLQMIYMDAGSGAEQPITPAMISAVRESVDLPIIVGGGIRTNKEIKDAFYAGADIVVIGNALEENPDLLLEFSTTIASL